MYLRLVPLALAIFLVATNGMLVAGILPPLSADFHASATEVGYSITYYSLLVAVLAPVLSIVLARMPRGLVVAGGLVLFSAGAVVAAVAPTLAAFIVGRSVSAVGAAAIMPTALAIAASLVPPERRGTALAITSAGFTLAAGLGAPAATALAAAGGWRTPVWVIAAVGLALAALVAGSVRGAPIAPPLSLGRRFAPLREPRLLVAFASTLLSVAAFNIVFIFLSEESAQTIHGSIAGLAGLQLVLGIASLVGSIVIGPIIDRLGSLASGTGTLAILTLGAALLSAAEPSLVATVAVLAVWGLAGGAAAVPIQHRIVGIDPERSAISLSWNSSAMYLGIAVAPVLGGIGLAGGASLVPLVAAVAGAAALTAFLLGRRDSSRIRRPSSRDPVARPADV